MNRNILVFGMFAVFVMSASFVWGHSGEDHEIEMLSVWGISLEDQVLADRFHPVIEVFRKNIDHGYEDFYAGLKAIMLPYKFTWGTYTHRIFFHWAFNGDPRNSTALRDCFNLSHADNTKIETGYQYIIYIGSDSVEGGEIARLLKKANDRLPIEEQIHTIPKGQSARNRSMINALSTLEHTPKKYNRAVATILYDTHIIGDYIEGKTGPQAAMTPLKDIVEDIIKHGIKEFDCDKNLQNECEKRIKQALRSAGSDTEKAQAVLNAMRDYIPKCVSNSEYIKIIVWGDKTPSSGIKSKEAATSLAEPEALSEYKKKLSSR